MSQIVRSSFVMCRSGLNSLVSTQTVHAVVARRHYQAELGCLSQQQPLGMFEEILIDSFPGSGKKTHPIQIKSSLDNCVSFSPSRVLKLPEGALEFCWQ